MGELNEGCIHLADFVGSGVENLVFFITILLAIVSITRPWTPILLSL
jgi:hypothetical protein